MNAKLRTTFAALLLLAGCDKPPAAPVEEESQVGEQVALESMPAVMPLTAEQRTYVEFLIKSICEVIQTNRPLAEKDEIFGNGKFFWPKDPKYPIKAQLSYGSVNFKLRRIEIGFSRANAKGPWRSGSMYMAPRNFPVGIYDVALDKKFFAPMTLENSYVEKNEHTSIKIANVFEYRLGEGGKSMQLIFRSRPDVSRIEDRYPRSFYTFEAKLTGDL